MQDAADVEWLAVENKVRRLVKDLVEPTVRRVVEDREQLSRMSKESELLKRKVDEFEFTASKVNKRFAAIDDVSKRQLDLEAGQKAVEAKMMQTAQSLRAEMELLNAEMQRKADYIKNFEKQIETMHGEIQAFHTSFDAMKEAVRLDVEEKQTSILQVISEVKDNHNALKEIVDSLSTQQIRINEKIGETAGEIEAIHKLISALRSKLEAVDSEKALKSTVAEAVEELDRVRTKAIAEKDYVTRKLKSMRTEWELQFPYQCQLLVAEWMHEVLEGKAKKKLCDREGELYPLWIDSGGLPQALSNLIGTALESSKIAAENLKLQEKDSRNKGRSSELLEGGSNSSHSHSSSPKRKHRRKVSGKASNRMDTEESAKKGSDTVIREPVPPRPVAKQSPTNARGRPPPVERTPNPPEVPDRLEARRISAIREELNPTPQFRRVDPSLPVVPPPPAQHAETITLREVPDSKSSFRPSAVDTPPHSPQRAAAPQNYSRGLSIDPAHPPAESSKHSSVVQSPRKPPGDAVSESSKYGSGISSPRKVQADTSPLRSPRRDISPVRTDEVYRHTNMQELEPLAMSHRTQEETESLGPMEPPEEVAEDMELREDSASATSRRQIGSRRGKPPSREVKLPQDSSESSLSRPVDPDSHSSHLALGSSGLVGNMSGVEPDSDHRSSAFRNYPSASSRPSHISGSPEPQNTQPHMDDAKSSVYSAHAQEFVAYFTDDDSESRESSGYDHPDLSDMKGQIEALSQRINTELAVLRDELSDRYADFMKDIRQNTEACNTLSKQVLNECAGLHGARKRDKNDVLKEIAVVQEEIGELRKQSDTYLGTMDKLAELLAHIVEFCRIGLTLSSQDEEDRESIALMGYREAQSPTAEASKTSVVSLDKSCLSCTGQSSIVISAFKMACLAYAPTPIMYRSSTFQRRELLEIQKRVLESAWTKANAADSWSRLKLRDLVDFIPLPKIKVAPSASKMSPTSWGSPMAPVFSETPEVVEETPKRAVSTLDHLPALPKASPGPAKRKK